MADLAETADPYSTGQPAHELLRSGVYTASEAARLTGVPAQRVRRWLRGYTFGPTDRRGASAPLWALDVPQAEGTTGLSFLDLVELRLVDRCLDAGVSLRTIRIALAAAQKVFGVRHPFATRRFQTDGRTIFIDVADAAGERQALDLMKSQYAFRRLVAPSFKDIEFGTEAAVRWWPLSQRRSVVLDPLRAFGQPIIADSGVPTAVLASAVLAEGSVQVVARWFETSVATVHDAVAFERKLAA
jgi:uncharacterized protein (DUF433 family)/DNA-binding transcriptional MerR regulator